tara:strand:- start:472 stop:594 length:123 start_codon:yes stop_codon:yes gene_type:complete
MQLLTSIFTIIGIINVTGALVIGILFLIEYISMKGEEGDE